MPKDVHLVRDICGVLGIDVFQKKVYEKRPRNPPIPAKASGSGAADLPAPSGSPSFLQDGNIDDLDIAPLPVRPLSFAGLPKFNVEGQWVKDRTGKDVLTRSKCIDYYADYYKN